MEADEVNVKSVRRLLVELDIIEWLRIGMTRDFEV
jgi:hypothetical protein